MSTFDARKEAAEALFAAGMGLPSRARAEPFVMAALERAYAAGLAAQSAGTAVLLREACMILDEARERIADEVGSWKTTGIEVRIATFVHRLEVVQALATSPPLPPGGAAATSTDFDPARKT